MPFQGVQLAPGCLSRRPALSSNSGLCYVGWWLQRLGVDDGMTLGSLERWTRGWRLHHPHTLYAKPGRAVLLENVDVDLDQMRHVLSPLGRSSSMQQEHRSGQRRAVGFSPAPRYRKNEPSFSKTANGERRRGEWTCISHASGTTGIRRGCIVGKVRYVKIKRDDAASICPAHPAGQLLRGAW